MVNLKHNKDRREGGGVMNEEKRKQIVAVFRAGLERRGFRHVLSLDEIPYYVHDDGRKLRITKDRHGDPKVERLDDTNG